MKTLFFHILPARDIDDGVNLIPLSDPDFRRRAFESIGAWVEEVQPPVLTEHETDGEIDGEIVDTIETEDGLWVEAEVTDDAYQAWVDRKVRHVSPQIAWNHRADTGEIIPAALLETSLVSIPRFAVGQKRATDVRPLSMSTKAFTVSVMAERPGVSGLIEVGMTPEELRAMIMEVCGALLDERLATSEMACGTEMGEGESIVEVEVAEAPAEPVTDKDKRIAELEARLAELDSTMSEDEEIAKDERIAELERLLAEAESRSTMSEKAAREADVRLKVADDLKAFPALSKMAENLVKTRIESESAYATALEVARVSIGSGARTARTAFSETITKASPAALPADPFEAAEKISREKGIPYTEAFAQVTAKSE